MSRYEFLYLGHTSETIQAKLNSLRTGQRIIDLVVIGGINVFGLVEYDLTPVPHGGRLIDPPYFGTALKEPENSVVLGTAKPKSKMPK